MSPVISRATGRKRSKAYRKFNQVISNTGFESPCSAQEKIYGDDLRGVSCRFSPLETPSVLCPRQAAGLPRITNGHHAGDLHFDDENCQLLARDGIDFTVPPLPYLEFLLEKASDSLSDSDPQRDSYKTNLNLFDNAFTRCYRKIPWSRWDLNVVVWADGGPREGMFFFPPSHKSTRIPLGRKRKSPRNSLRRAQSAISAREGR